MGCKQVRKQKIFPKQFTILTAHKKMFIIESCYFSLFQMELLILEIALKKQNIVSGIQMTSLKITSVSQYDPENTFNSETNSIKYFQL